MARPDSGSEFFAIGFLGYKSKLIVLGVGAYISGFLLMSLSDFVLGILAAIVGYSTRKFFKPFAFENMAKYDFWRRSARKFVGNDLTPQVLESFDETAFQTALIQANGIVDINEKSRQVSELNLQSTALRSIDLHWPALYKVLRVYFVKMSPLELVGAYSASALGATGWAIILVIAHCDRSSWVLWVAGMLSIFMGLLGTFWGLVVGGSFDYDFSSLGYCAALLREIKREEAARN
jgi:hypothetical protein